MSSGSFQIRIKDNEDNLTILNVNKNMGIKEVKELFIQEHPEIEYTRTLEFFFKGEQLSNEKTIGDCKIKPNNTLSALNMEDNIEAAFLK